MPLQVEMEEGPRSKAVHFSRLQYCQYNQEKISLITVLSDHVWFMQTYAICKFCSGTWLSV